MKTGNALAFDRASVRSKDEDGRLHVASTPISKANVCGYLGSEIPDGEALGLDPDKVYRLYRDPEELAKAAKTFNNLPLLRKHVPVSAQDYQPDLVIGSTGTDAEFVAPYLKNSLVVWAQDAIDAIEAGTQRELSSAYRYVADMTPGEADGEKYDGVMRSLIGNHVAVVESGRAGPDVVVGDEAIKPKQDTNMTKLRIPKGAVSVAALYAALKPKLAADANLADFHTLIDSIKTSEESPGKDEDGKAITDVDLSKKDADVPPANPEADNGAGEDDDEDAAFDAEPIRAWARDNLEPEKAAELEKLLGPKKAEDEADPGAEKKAAAFAGEKEKDDKVSKPAMDAALAAVRKDVIKQMQDATAAREFVRPHVGNLPIALDSAEAVLRAAAGVLGIPSAKTVHESALRDLITFKVAAKPTREPAHFAQDAASAKSYAEQFPGAAKIRHI